MKHQQVVVDYWTMFKTMFTYLVLVAGAWLMFRLFHAVFWFPKILQGKHEEIARKIEYHTKRLQETMEKNQGMEDGDGTGKEAVTNESAEREEREEISGQETKKEK
ncbi:uncharacterized protein LOC129810084 [Phlebotomus papatasi]|uniref:uncharacterized protein LOC129810084 n=1 Tax=Phlebotomus papatasi TaxID=29031 RepID=UPI0024839156|nr:uncharacterized protein LOC129810084 [Phlebotomus papatasi]